MCLLIKQPASTVFSDEFLRGVYNKNSDGIGVMWAENGQLCYKKVIVSTATEAIKFIRDNAEGKECCIHFRMKTHGNIDMTNCHPYPVRGFDGSEETHPMLMMHNGVLSTGNDADRTKSDTWHFINDYLRPILADNPELVFKPEFIKMLGLAIGSNNKFALMDHLGNCAIVNEKAGVTYEGAWLSNTYAWDYYGLHPEARNKHYGGYGGYGKEWTRRGSDSRHGLGLYGSYYDDIEWEDTKPGKSGLGAKAPTAPKDATNVRQFKKDRVNTKRGGNGSSTNRNTIVQGALGTMAQDLKNDGDTIRSSVVEYFAAMQQVSEDMFAVVRFDQVKHLLNVSSFRDPWDLLDMWEMGVLTDEDFKAVMDDPSKLGAMLTKAAVSFGKQKDEISSHEVTDTEDFVVGDCPTLPALTDLDAAIRDALLPVAGLGA